jgi:hypothetical protein
MQSCLSHACYLPLPFNFPSFDHTDYVWQEIQIMKILFMLLSIDFKWLCINSINLWLSILAVQFQLIGTRVVLLVQCNSNWTLGGIIWYTVSRDWAVTVVFHVRSRQRHHNSSAGDDVFRQGWWTNENIPPLIPVRGRVPQTYYLCHFKMLLS